MAFANIINFISTLFCCDNIEFGNFCFRKYYDFPPFEGAPLYSSYSSFPFLSVSFSVSALLHYAGE